MIQRKRLIATAIIGAGVILGCDGQRSTSPTTSSSALLSARSNGASPSFSNVSSRSGRLHMIKACPNYTRLAGSYCTITSSDLAQIEAGSRVVYAAALVDGKLDSDLFLDPPGPGNNIAFGHVKLDLTISPPRGVVTFSGGTGKFTHFNATIDVTPRNGGGWNWDGPYSFQP